MLKSPFPVSCPALIICQAGHTLAGVLLRTGGTEPTPAGLLCAGLIIFTPWGAHSGLGSPVRPPESVPAPLLLSWLCGLGGVPSPLWASVDKETMNPLQPAVFSTCPAGLPGSFETPFYLAPTQTNEIRVSEGSARQLSQPRCKVHQERGRGSEHHCPPSTQHCPWNIASALRVRMRVRQRRDGARTSVTTSNPSYTLHGERSNIITLPPFFR